MSITLKWYYVRQPNPIEKSWKTRFFGQSDTEELIRRCYKMRKESKKGNTKISPDTIRYLNESNKKLPDQYNTIKKKYPEDFGELKGFKETILALVCPIDLIDVYKMEGKEIKNSD